MRMDEPRQLSASHTHGVGFFDMDYEKRKTEDKNYLAISKKRDNQLHVS